MKMHRSDLRESLLSESTIPGRGTLAMAMAIVVVLAMALIAMLLWENWANRSRALADARLSVYHESRVLGESALTTMEIADLALAHVAEDVRRQGDGAVLDVPLLTGILQSINPWFPSPAGLSVHDGDGRIVAAIGLVQAAEDVSNLAFFRDHQKGSLEYAISAEGPPARIRLSRRLATQSDDFAGVVSAVIDAAALDLSRGLDVTRRVDGAALVLRSGEALTMWPSTIGHKSDLTDIGDLPPFAQIPRSALTARGIEIIETDATVIAVAPVRNAPFLVAAAISKDRILSDWRSSSWLVFMAVIAIVALIGIVGIWLSHRQARRRAVIEGRLRVLSRAVEDSPIMTLITDSGGRIEYANRKLEDVTGYLREEILGQTPRILKSGDTSPATYGTLWRTILGGEEWSGVVRNRKKDGELFWASLLISPIKDRRGRITNFVGVAEDITDRIEKEMHRRQLEKAQALGCLAGGVAHEFNNMLMPILGMTGEVMHTLPAASSERGMLELAMQGAEKARDLIQRILVFTDDDPDRWCAHDVSDLVNGCLAMSSVAIPQNITLETSIPPDIGWVYANIVQIEAAMINLVSNAVHAMKTRKGTLGVTLVRADPNEPDWKFPADLRLVPHAVIQVSDTGNGIAPEIIGQIFDPFFTTREVGQGAGLGLAIVHGVVTAHGGALTVDSTVDAGTTFSIFLPLIDPHSGLSATSIQQTP
ncbi:MAG: PAS domain S-box protein [Rhodospirillales bacterium]|jgi:PAS domain S-box-containing protein|nr:PAS domain S-box protein [Rhodospirillales bacterium]